MARTHYPKPNVASAVAMSLCGIPGSTLRDDPAQVDCKLCLRAMSAEAVAKRGEHPKTVDDFVREVLAMPTRPPIPGADIGLPFLTPETWARRNCICGRCTSCLYYQALSLDMAAPAPKARLRRDPERPRWGSVTAALDEFAALVSDGYTFGNGPSGGLDRIARYGVRVQTPPRSNAFTEVHEHAEAVALFDELIRLIYADRFIITKSRTLKVGECADILCAHVVGHHQVIKTKWSVTAKRLEESYEAIAERHDIGPNTAREVVKVGRRRLLVELAVRGMVPALKETHPAFLEYEARLSEMEKGRAA